MYSLKFSESYGYRQLVFEKFAETKYNQEIYKYKTHGVLDKPTEKMERVIDPVERLKHLNCNISCKIFEKENTSEKIYWFSGLSNDKTGFLNCLKSKHGENKIVMMSQNIGMMSSTFFNSLNFYQSGFLNCDFSDLILKKAKFHDCTFVNCSFNKSVFEDCTLFKCSFKFCNMSDTKFARGLFNVEDDTGSNFVDSEFENKSSEQRKKIEETRKSLQQISSSNTSQTDSLASTLHSTGISCPVAQINYDATDWKIDMDEMIPLTLSSKYLTIFISRTSSMIRNEIHGPSDNNREYEE